MTKRIGILTSGGDCAGLNAVIRAVVYASLNRGWQVAGIRHGIQGLLERPLLTMDLDETFGGLGPSMLYTGGTILGSIRKGSKLIRVPLDLESKIVADQIVEGYKLLNLDALVAIGGDGSFRTLAAISEGSPMKLVCIPKTIDNDLAFTESVGFMTAVNVATEALDRLQPTAASHNRIMILEVMGRDAGHIALNAGIAGGADVILIPELPFHGEKVVQKMNSLREKGRNFGLIVVAESAKEQGKSPVMITDTTGKTRYGGVGQALCDYLASRMDAEVRVTVLGHVQRGGQPSARDRILATCLGAHAVDMIEKNRFGYMAAYQDQGIMDIPLKEAIKAYRSVDTKGEMIRAARELGVSFGD